MAIPEKHYALITNKCNVTNALQALRNCIFIEGDGLMSDESRRSADEQRKLLEAAIKNLEKLQDKIFDEIEIET